MAEEEEQDIGLESECSHRVRLLLPLCKGACDRWEMHYLDRLHIASRVVVVVVVVVAVLVVGGLSCFVSADTFVCRAGNRKCGWAPVLSCHAHLMIVAPLL